MPITSYTVPTSSSVSPLPTNGGSGGNLAEILDHCDQAVSRLLAQYADSTRLQALLCSYVERLQELESAVYDVHTKALSLDDAEGAQLDLLGRIVRESRDGRADDVYRLALKVRVLVNISDGRAEQLIQIARLFESMDLVTGSYVSVQDLQPARMEVRVVTTPINDPAEVDKRLRQAKAGGVALTTLIHYGGVSGSFTFSRAADYPAKNTTQGFEGIAGPVAGGTLAHARA